MRLAFLVLVVIAILYNTETERKRNDESKD